MKLVQHFKDFLVDTVNLNASRVTLLEDSIEVLKDVIRKSNWEPHIGSFAPHGSWSHKTIIKPVANNAFDADLLVFIKPVDGWVPKDYVATLRKVFADHSGYKDKVRRYSHCITIEYAGERKIDIAPCVVDRDGIPRLEVCNHDTNAFEASEPKQYTDWLIERNAWTGGNGLRKVTRLLKYLRDIKTTFSCPSFLLTTLLGNRITFVDSFNDADFEDLPSALKTIVGRLDDWLQANPTRPTVTNPVLPSEVLSDVWDDARYKNFRDRINTYRGWIDDAYCESDRTESIRKWRRVFGDDFAKDILVEKAAAEAGKKSGLLNDLAKGLGEYATDLVALVGRYGRQAVPADFHRQPHKQPVRWSALPRQLFQIHVRATCHSSKNGSHLASVDPEIDLLPKQHWLQFRARTGNGLPISNEFQTHWRITNTGEDARRAGCMRGGFERSNGAGSRWEPLAYRGVHMVEAFVVRKRDNALVAQSEPFYVVIQ